MILTLARGHYCPKEHQQHLELAASYPKIGYWFWGRPSFYDLWQDLLAAMAESRRDWDLSAPGLRQAWDAGDYSPFHGWDRRSGRAAV